MTRSRTDTVKVRAYNVRSWWYRRTAWQQIFIAAGLLCMLELLVAWRMYPFLLSAVTA